MSKRSSAVLFNHDAELYRVLRRDVAPLLRTWAFPKVWQFGLKGPGDPWSTAIVLREEGLFARARVYATDPSAGRIRASRDGAFSRARVASSVLGYVDSGGSATLDEYYAVDGPRVTMRPLLSSRISFFEHDPRHDASFNEFQLVLWSPPGDAAVGQRAAWLIRESLCRFGFVAVLAAEAPRVLTSWPYHEVGPRLFRREC
jgi:chemotaxis protein methyltransferase CheR